MNDSDAKPQSPPTLKDFIASIDSVDGDLSSTITAPPFVLDTKSVLELPASWAERPSFFVAAASAPDPAQRALLVLRWFLASLKNLQHFGRPEEGRGVRKPFNPFLGESFLAKWEDQNGETLLVSEQVSHHPPVTACRLWNEQHGVSAEGFTRPEVTLNLGNIVIKHSGHLLLTLQTHNNEGYLIPFPNLHVKGIHLGLSGIYPELEGTYTIPCTSGHYSVIVFGGKSGLLSGPNGNKNQFEAKLYAPAKVDITQQHAALYTIKGNWNDSFTIYTGTETSKSTARENITIGDLTTVPLQLLEKDVNAQDPWESRRAWKPVREALIRGDMMGAAKAKSAIEQGQRAMRKEEEEAGKKWETLFFKPQDEDLVAASLYKSILKDLTPEDTVAIWKFDKEFWEQGLKRPFHGTLTPDNKNDSGKESEKANGNGHHIVVAGHTIALDHDDGLSSPASFKTAQEFPFPNATQQDAADPPAKTAVATTGPTITPKPVQTPRTPIRRSFELESNGGVTPSSSSVSPSTRRGKRQRARESIGKFRLSLTSSLSKIGSSPNRADGEAES